MAKQNGITKTGRLTLDDNHVPVFVLDNSNTSVAGKQQYQNEAKYARINSSDGNGKFNKVTASGTTTTTS